MTYPTTFERDGKRYEWLPCEDWGCRREHVTLQTGPALADFHPVKEAPRG